MIGRERTGTKGGEYHKGQLQGWIQFRDKPTWGKHGGELEQTIITLKMNLITETRAATVTDWQQSDAVPHQSAPDWTKCHHSKVPDVRNNILSLFSFYVNC